MNGHGYLGDIASVPPDSLPGSSRPDNQLWEGNGPTIPLGHPPPGGDGTGEDVLYPDPSFERDLFAETAEALAVPAAAAPSYVPGKWLRGLIGVDEKLLDRVWEERARYTGLGAIVLGTATMAALSMLDALDQILGPVWPVLVLVWFLSPFLGRLHLRD